MAKNNQVAVANTDNQLSVNTFNYEQKIALLTPEEREKYNQLTKKIDIRDITTVQQYGSDLNSVMSNNGDMLLQSVRCDNTNEVDVMVNELLSQLNLIDIDKLKDTNWKRLCRKIPFLAKWASGMQQLFSEYETIASKVEQISKKFESAKTVAKRDNTTLEQIATNTRTYIEQVRELIIGLKLKMNDITAEMERLRQDPTIELYQLHDFENFKNTMEKRIANLETEEYILTQNMFQIQALQANNDSIADKSDEIMNNIIPLWKTQIAISVIMNNQTASVEAQKKLSQTTNEMLKKNAAILKMNSVNVARESERQIVDLDTLQTITQNLIETVTEVKRIHDEGNQNRKAIETSLQSFAGQLSGTLLALNGK